MYKEVLNKKERGRHMNVLIGGAWVYANGSMHIGHIAALIAGDVIARYYRQKGERVCYVSGSDCHGTPITLKAKEERKCPEDIVENYHREFVTCFDRLGFSYDHYGKTSSKNHKTFVLDFHKELYSNKEAIVEKEVEQAYCDHCHEFLPDRYVEGKCPVCGEYARGDQCDACGTVIEPESLQEAICTICGKGISLKRTNHLYLKLSKYDRHLKSLVNQSNNWRDNAVNFTNRYLDEGLRDRPITRDISWGVNVPREGYEDKRIYIWAENVLGYLSATKAITDQETFDQYWKNDKALHYYIHGKDNIPFHSIILPGLLLAHGQSYHLPDRIISSEYLTLDHRKISTSRNYAVWVKDLLERYDPDSIRYFLIINGPEKRDTDFSYREFIKRHNSELLGAYGNFIHRSLVFIAKYFDSIVPEGKMDEEVGLDLQKLYSQVGAFIEDGQIKQGLDTIFGYIRKANKYFDEKKPWETRTMNIEACQNTLYNCIQIIANLATLLKPFIPFSSDKLLQDFQLNDVWELKKVASGYLITKPEILFDRIAKEVVDEENQRLHERVCNELK